MGDPLQLLQSQFGFDSFREGQGDAIDKLLAGKSVVAIFPTGAGKSLCYQLPALLLDGITLVVSPLIALMKDQIDFLESKGIPAARIDSSLTWDVLRDVYSKLRTNELKILYIAPERLANERFLQTLSQQTISLLAVDEAHCISEWGHNFRPDYLKLARLAKQLNVERVLALTATATPAVAQQIAAAFDIDPADVVATGFYRRNLSLMVSPVRASQRDAMLLDRLKRRPPGPTIVYVTLQKTAMFVAAKLRDAGFDAAAYHAGLDADIRTQVQDHFMASTDAIVVATIAFGMGIDKRDIRYVYHYNLPKTLENYAQEIGRAGRDGNDSVCEMLACTDDRITLENFTFGDTPDAQAVYDLVSELMNLGETFDISVYDLSFRHDMRPLVVETLITYLQLLGLLESVGSFYTEYKFRWLKPQREVLATFDARRQEFLRTLLSHAKAAKTWSNIDLHAAAEKMGEPRDRLVAALNYLNDQGAMEIEVAGARQAFRRTATSVNPPELSDQLTNRFLDRERRDVERMDQVIAFANEERCHTRKLVEYFGETFDHDCGHCGYCKGHRPGPLHEPVRRQLSDADRAGIESLRAEVGHVLTTPRKLARFLCGITSPAATRARLGKHASFGAWEDVPFAEVIEFVSEE